MLDRFYVTIFRLNKKPIIRSYKTERRAWNYVHIYITDNTTEPYSILMMQGYSCLYDFSFEPYSE